MTGATDSGPWPPGIARTCANGDGRKTILTVGGIAYCGPCALEAVKRSDVAEVT